MTESSWLRFPFAEVLLKYYCTSEYALHPPRKTQLRIIIIEPNTKTVSSTSGRLSTVESPMNAALHEDTPTTSNTLNKCSVSCDGKYVAIDTSSLLAAHSKDRREGVSAVHQLQSVPAKDVRASNEARKDDVLQNKACLGLDMRLSIHAEHSHLARISPDPHVYSIRNSQVKKFILPVFSNLLAGNLGPPHRYEGRPSNRELGNRSVLQGQGEAPHVFHPYDEPSSCSM